MDNSTKRQCLTMNFLKCLCTSVSFKAITSKALIWCVGNDKIIRCNAVCVLKHQGEVSCISWPLSMVFPQLGDLGSWCCQLTTDNWQLTTHRGRQTQVWSTVVTNEHRKPAQPGSWEHAFCQNVAFGSNPSQSVVWVWEIYLTFKDLHFPICNN